MAHYDPQDAFETLKQRVTQTVSNHFPIAGKKNTLVAAKVWVDDNKDLDDIRSQQRTKLNERTWAVPVKAELELRDNTTGKVKDRKEVTLAQLPKITNRYTYIVDGNEWQVNNQFRLKSGVYTHVKASGELASQWNLAKGLNFDMDFDPESKKMSIQFAGTGANIPLYPVLKSLGVDDDTIEKKWGKEVLTANMKDKEDVALRKFYKSITGEQPASLEQARSFVREEFSKTQLRPDSTKFTLGKAYDKVDGNSLMAGSEKILNVLRGKDTPDDRDSLEFKDLFSAEDLLSERLEKKHKWTIQRKLGVGVDKHTSVASIVSPDTFGKPIREFFTSSSHSERPEQFNPMTYITGNRRTTIRGEGGITKAEQVTPEAKSINPSHLGFLDPIFTPESEAAGITLQLAAGAQKVGNSLLIDAINAKTGKTVKLDPGTALRSTLAYPDQYVKSGNKWEPTGDRVKVSDPRGVTTTAKPDEVDYILKSPKGVFDLSTNLIPFLQNDQGNRTTVAARQIEQAVSLKDREQPLVQVKSELPVTFEKVVGGFNSHRSPVDGVVERVGRQGVVIKAKDGTKHEVQFYDDFPLNDDKSVLNSTPLVKAGDAVKKGQTVGDTNYTKEGVLALGTNLKTAYMPWKGLNFEDAVVISESAAKKLTSDHMFRSNISQEKNIILNKKNLVAEIGGVVSKKVTDKLDDDGVIREGETVEPGDILIGALKKEEITPEKQQVSLFSKRLVKAVRPATQTWEKDVPGKVARVVKHGKKVTVYVKAETPADVGDKLVGRHGNKGIISYIVPDYEMPHDKDGKAAEILLNPAGVPGRINLGQVLETAASKIAEKTGKPYIVNNFDPTVKDYTRALKAELEKHGLSDTEEMFDPITKKSFGPVLFGNQYLYKLHHTASKGLSVRSRDAYDSNLQPKGGGPSGAQTMDANGLYALLAHNARANIQEMQTLKSEHNDDFWAQLQSGDSIPTPKTPFVFKKFEGYLKTMGIDIDKQGNDLVLQPLTDKKTLQMSSGKLSNPSLSLVGRNLKPEKGGIFDPIVTGTSNRSIASAALGTKWSHIELSERMPNPVFEAPARTLLGLSQKDYDSVVKGNKEIDGKTGPSAIVEALKRVDVGEEKKNLERQISTLRASALDAANKKLKYLRALDRVGMNPKEAYTMKYLPVLPPIMRPVGILPNGSLNFDDINKLYTMIGSTNDQLSKHDPAVIPDEEANPLRAELYDGLKSLTLTGATNKGRHLNSVAATLAGVGSPKEGFFQKKVIGKRQDLSMRSTIVPGPSMSLDEIGLPRKAAKELYKPFIVARLARGGMSPLQAQKEIKEDTFAANKALENVVAERPLIVKRDPVLHKYGVQAFKPKLIEGKAIQLHPLVCAGYGADFDGDKMSAYVPISTKAVREAVSMVPSNNLFNPSNGSLMFKPTQESMLGLYKLTEMPKAGIAKRFTSGVEAALAVKDGKIGLNDLVSLKDLGKDFLDKTAAAPVKTTVGRLMVYNALPEAMRDKKILTDPNFVLDNKTLNNLLSTVAREHHADFGKVSDRLKNMGNENATGLSIGLSDFMSDFKYRDHVLREAGKVESKILSDPKLSYAKKEEKVVELYGKAAKEISAKAEERMKTTPNRMYDWVRSGARGNWNQFKQITVSPILVSDHKGKTVPIPIGKSYSEGLDIGSYWAAMHGARMGMISKVEGTWKPGLAGKQIMQATMNQLVTGEDCGTNKGLRMSSESRDILNRFTVGDIELGTRGGKEKGVIPSGTLITPDVMSRLKNNKVQEVTVRSPLKCAHGKGVCAKCFGLNAEGELYPEGTNVGVIAAHSLGEPSTQLSLKVFHTGGVVGAKETKAQNMFDRLDQLLNLPKKLPGAATLAQVDGKISRVEKDVAAGGWNVYIQDQKHYIPGTRELTVRRGEAVKKGDSLSTGPKDPREMLPLVGLNHVQSYLVNEIQSTYGNEVPLSRRNTETFVRALTNLSEVTDPGNHPNFLRGDRVPTSEVREYNRNQKSDTERVKHRPILTGVKMLPLEMQEDWLARMQSTNLRKTLIDAASEGWRSVLHGTHPIPGMAVGANFGVGTQQEPWLY